MAELHKDSILDYLTSTDVEAPKRVLARKVQIANAQGQTLEGILVRNSIAIPFYAPDEAAVDIKTMVANNLVDLNLGLGNDRGKLICKLLGLPFYGHTSGIYSDAQFFGQIGAIHLHPDPHVSSQEDFFKLVSGVLTSKGFEITIN